MSFVKLSELSKAKATFLVESVKDPVYKMYDVGSKKMVSSPTWSQGMSKKYGMVTDKGEFDLGEQNFGTLLAQTYEDGTASLIGRSFKVGDNGKEGMEIRYFFNVVKDHDYSQAAPTHTSADEGIDPDSIRW